MNQPNSPGNDFVILTYICYMYLIIITKITALCSHFDNEKPDLAELQDKVIVEKIENRSRAMRNDVTIWAFEWRIYRIFLFDYNLG